MIINFRQGIITYPTTGTQQSFLVRNGTNITLSTANGRVDLAFAHGAENYLLTEASTIVNAWTNLPAATDCWLYVDINPRTAIRTFGYSLYAPVTAAQFTAAAQTDQHWFDITTSKMRVYQSGQFREVIRLFLAKVKDNTFTPLGNGFPTKPYAGTQVGLSGSAITTGRIMIDDAGNPIRRVDGRFITTENEIFVEGSPVNTVRIESNILTGTAMETMAKYQVVKLSGFGQLHLAQYPDIETTAVAMLMEDLNVGETGTICLQGHITNPTWNWQTAGAPLWVTGSGLLTEVNPHVANALSHPVDKVPVARVITRHSVYFDQGLGGKGEKGDDGSGSGGSGLAELPSIVLPNMMGDDRISPPDGTPATRGYHAYVGNDTSHPIFPNGQTNFPSGEVYKLLVSVDAYDPVEVVINSGSVTTFQTLAELIVDSINTSLGSAAVTYEFRAPVSPGSDDGGTMRFYSTTYGAASYIDIDENVDAYMSTRPLSTALTMYTQTGTPIELESTGIGVYVSGYYEYPDLPHQHGKDGYDTLPYVDEYYIVAPQGTPVGLWSAFHNWDLVVYDTAGTWKSLGDVRTLLDGKRVGIAMDNQSFIDLGRTPSGTFTGKKGAIATLSGGSWSIEDPVLGSTVSVVETSTFVDPYNKRRRYRLDAFSGGMQWFDIGDSASTETRDRVGSPNSTNVMHPSITKHQPANAPLVHRVTQPSWNRSGFANRAPMTADDVINIQWTQGYEILRGFNFNVSATDSTSIVCMGAKSTNKPSKIDLCIPEYTPQFHSTRPSLVNRIGLGGYVVPTSNTTLSNEVPSFFVTFSTGTGKGQLTVNPYSTNTGIIDGTGIRVDTTYGTIVGVAVIPQGAPAWSCIHFPPVDTYAGGEATSITRFVPSLGKHNSTGLSNTHTYDIELEVVNGIGTVFPLISVGQAFSDDISTFAGLINALNARLSIVPELSGDGVRACWSFNSLAFVGQFGGSTKRVIAYNPGSTANSKLLSSLVNKFTTPTFSVSVESCSGTGPGPSGSTPVNYDSSSTTGMKGFSWTIPLVPAS